jgi:hypothetical protein
MSLMSIFRTYQKELVSAVVGAAVAGVLSMSAGLYSLTKSFEYTQNKEQLASLRKDLEFLARVRNEVDANTQTLVGTDYRIKAKFGEPKDWLSAIMKPENGKNSPSIEQIDAFRAMGVGPVVPVLELSAPREKLVVESWGNQFPESGDIAFDLLTDINEYYRRIRRINLSVERMDNISAGTGIAAGFHASLVKDIEHHNVQVDDLRKLDTVKLKNRINDEIRKLSESRKKLSSAISVG